MDIFQNEEEGAPLQTTENGDDAVFPVKGGAAVKGTLLKMFSKYSHSHVMH